MVSTLSVARHAGGRVIVGGGGRGAGAGVEGGADIDRGLATGEGPQVPARPRPRVRHKLEILPRPLARPRLGHRHAPEVGGILQSRGVIPTPANLNQQTLVMTDDSDER